MLGTMRWLGTGIGVLGGIALAFGLVGAASAPFRTAGALTVAIGLALVGFDAFARFSVRRRAVGRLRRDLAEAQARGLAAIDRLRLAGLQGEARVVALTDTGASFNQRPEL